MSDHLVLFITVPNSKVATTLSHALVEEKLAACVNRIPGVQSTYFWQGEVTVDEELLLIVKTRAALFDALQARVKEIHPYTVPEIIALPIVRGSGDYLAWIDEVTERT